MSPDPAARRPQWQLVATITQDVRAHCPLCDDWNDIVEDLPSLLALVAEHNRERHPGVVLDLPRLGHSFASPNWQWERGRDG